MNAIEFFARESGLCIEPGQTEAQARAQCAWRLVCAEVAAHEAGAWFEWSIDPEITSAEWSDDEPAYQTWQCVMYMPDDDGDRTAIDSLHGIDLGPDGHPTRDKYARVVEAELAENSIGVLLGAMLPSEVQA
jgi:hypothetical protein